MASSGHDDCSVTSEVATPLRKRDAGQLHRQPTLTGDDGIRRVVSAGVRLCFSSSAWHVGDNTVAGELSRDSIADDNFTQPGDMPQALRWPLCMHATVHVPALTRSRLENLQGCVCPDHASSSCSPSLRAREAGSQIASRKTVSCARSPAARARMRPLQVPSAPLPRTSYHADPALPSSLWRRRQVIMQDGSPHHLCC